MARSNKSAPVAQVEDGQRVMRSGTGKWAGEQMLKALAAGKSFSASVLRTADTLSKDEWVILDEALVEEGKIRLRGVADLMAAGLTKPVANGLGKTVLQWEKISDMNPASVSLDGMAKTEGDRQEFTLNSLPLPITHKDFYINLRTLTASRERGESLDTTQARTAGRLVSEAVEAMLFLGGPTFGGAAIYGYTTHPNRNTGAIGTSWASDTGENILTDVLAMITALEGDRFYGPYNLYIPSGYSAVMGADFKAASDKTIRQRILELDQINSVTVVDSLAANHVVMVQLTSDVVQLVEGEPLQTVQWDIEGGFQINFKAFTIMVPLVKSDAQGRSGVVHFS